MLLVTDFFNKVIHYFNTSLRCHPYPYENIQLLIFKLADRMRSMRTNGASKNRDWSNQNGDDFPHEQI